MAWNLEEGRMSPYHCALDGKAMKEDSRGGGPAQIKRVRGCESGGRQEGRRRGRGAWETHFPYDGSSAFQSIVWGSYLSLFIHIEMLEPQSKIMDEKIIGKMVRGLEDYKPPDSQSPNKSKAKINTLFSQPFTFMKEINVKEIKLTSDRLYISFPPGVYVSAEVRLSLLYLPSWSPK